MKKLSSFLVGLALTAGTVLAADTNTATSVNAVGFVNKTLPPNGNLTFVSVNFDPVGAVGENSGISIQDLLTGQLTGGLSASSGDNIFVWDTANQRYDQLFLVAGSGNPSYDGKWVRNADFSIATNMLPNGSAFWIRNTHSFTQQVTFAGQVVDRFSKTNTMNFAFGMNMFGFPYSATVPVNSNDLSKAATGGLSLSTGDNLIIWDVVNQRYVFYFLVAGSGNPSYDGKWVNDADFSVATNNFELATGYWFRRQNAGSVQWNSVQLYSIQ
jgi:hypothetical protein